MSWLDSNSMLITQKSLDFVWEKQKAISENISNSTVPGYKAKYVTFEDELKANLLAVRDRTKASDIKKEILSTDISYHTSLSESTRLDGNNVNVDVESMELARAQLQYDFLTRQITDQFTRLRMVIEGR